MRRKVAAVTVGVAMFVAACGGDPPALPDDADAELRLGEQIYAESCARCHAADGGGGRGPKLAGGAFLEKYPTVADQVQLVRQGRATMPAFGDRLTDDEIAAVVRYTREVLAPS